MTGTADPAPGAAFRRGCRALALLAGLGWASQGLGQPAESAAPFSQTIENQGVTVAASIVPIGDAAARPGVLTEGDEVHVQFRIGDSATGLALRGAYPAAWLDRADAETGDAQQCQRRVRRLLSGGLFSRSELDLNVYYVLALNADATISVVDPLFGFGGSKLLSLIQLQSPGEDWAITEDQDWLYVSMPETGAVAAVDTRSWQVVEDIEVGARPGRLAIQPDQAYLWVAVEGGVAVLRTAGREIAARIETGAGPHDIAFSPDSRYAFVTNRTAGNVTVIDIATLTAIKQVAAGAAPVSVDYSEMAGTAYVASESDGVITAIEGRTLAPIARMQAAPGLAQIRVAPGGRHAFAPNPERDTVSILDLASNRIVQTAVVLEGPDQITFTNELAYVRHRDSEVVLMIPLKEIGAAGRDVPVIDFSGGQHPLGRTSNPARADSIVQASGAYGVLVANPADEAIYYYKEGMAAPMGSFNNYGREPRAALTVERNLREQGPGLYQTTVKLQRAGAYQLAFFLNAPRVVHCFELEVAADPDRQVVETGPRVAVEPLRPGSHFQVGEPLDLAFRLTDAATGAPVESLTDFNVLVFSPVWQARSLARHTGDGVYSVRVRIPQGGFFRVLAASPSMRLPFTEQFSLTDAAAAGRN